MQWIIFRAIRAPNPDGPGLVRMRLRVGEVDADNKREAERLARGMWRGELVAVSRVSHEMTAREYAASRATPYWCDVLPRGSVDEWEVPPVLPVVVPPPDPDPPPPIVDKAEMRRLTATASSAARVHRIRARQNRLAALARQKIKGATDE